MSEISNKKIILKIRVLYKNLLLIIIHRLSNCYRKLNKNSPLSNPQDFEDFTPIILNDKDDKYSDIIKYAVENTNTKNVALTGPYGSGKSSILKTFEDKYPKYKYLNISLATFDEKGHHLKEIEYCILKQLFYKVEQNKIPESRFKRIVNQKNVKIKAVFIFLWLISLIYFFKPILLNDITKILAFDFYSKIGNIIYTLYFIGGSIYFLYKTMGFILNFKLTKFSFQDTEIENGDDKKSVNFESEIDEILYFFERNPFDVIFIEDLDRFKNTEIYIKLREINYLINNYDPIKNKRKITFIYAVQDDTFKEDERAKFFDFIIPVIPVINYSNSSTELLDNIDINQDGIPKFFIKQVARYLSDKRTLISINNEYKIYKNIIGNDLDKTKLLAMMIYKNVEPTDFDNLNSQKGYVYKIFNDNNKLIKSTIDTIDIKITEKKNKIEMSKDEMINNVNELRSLYVLKAFELLNAKQNNAVKSIEINSSQLTISQLLTDANFILFSKLININFYIFNSYNSRYDIQNSNISFKSLESEIGIYSERLKLIENKKDTKVNEFKKEIEKLESEKQVLRTKKIKDIVTDDYLQKCLDSLEKKENIKLRKIINEKETIITEENTIYYKIQNIDLINYLIRYGHIDDSYSHYISYFYPGTITKEDNEFLKSFTNNKPLPYNFKLKEIESLFPDILKSDFSREEILNFSLMDYILERNNIVKELAQIIALLSTKMHKPTNFIDEYITYTVDANKKSFLQALCKYWKNPNQNIWEEIMSNFSPDKHIEYLNLLFSNLDLHTLLALNVKDKLSDYISEIESLKSFKDIDTEITAFILETNLKFIKIDNLGSKIIFDFIYNNNNYEINEKMIELFVNLYKQNEVNLELLKEANYTTIKNSGASKLIKYIDLNIEFYIKEVFLKLENNCNESEEIIIELLNDNYEDFGPELIIEIINKNQTPIQDISKITHSELWITLLQEDKIAVSWDNLLYYFKEKESFDNVLVNYLNIEEHYSQLSKVRINKDFDKIDTDFANKFAKELIKSEISLISFSTLNYSFPYSYSDARAEFKDISNEKIKVLIQKRTISLSLKNYNFINEEFTDLLLIYLETNSNKFIDEVVTYELNSSIISKLIDSKVFNTEQKMMLMDHTIETVLTENKDISNKVCNLLATNRKTKVSIDLLRDLLSQSQSTEDKIRLFNIYQNDIDGSELKSIIQILGNPHSEIIEGKYPKFVKNEYNLEFINQRKKDFITKSDLVDNGKFIRVHTKRKTI
ncbi:MAG: hypothetical protein ACOH1N_09860 [Lutibacter sp.]